jgi:serpin B
MKRILWIVMAFLAIGNLFGSACSPLGGPQVEADNIQPVQFLHSDTARLPGSSIDGATAVDLAEANQAFAFELYRAVIKDQPGNLIFSPYSISLAFSMVYAGARGESEAQMAQVMGFLAQAAHHPAFNALDQKLNALGSEAPEDEFTGEPFQLSIANAMWGQQGYPFKQEFLETLALNYGAGLRAVDFKSDPEAARQAINQWINEQTQGRIPEMAPEGTIDPMTRLALANAIYFKGGWQYPFSESATEDGPFTLLDGRQVSVPLMSRFPELTPYLERDGFKAALLPYTGGAIDMLVILPEEGRFESVEAQMNAEFLSTFHQEAVWKNMRLVMPKLDFESQFDLVELLTEMGMPAPFDMQRADLSGIAEEENLYISGAMHKANITVDEKGTEAAAATLIVVGATGIQEDELLELRLDRPFIFTILERETGTILFLGRVINPAE